MEKYFVKLVKKYMSQSPKHGLRGDNKRPYSGLSFHKDDMQMQEENMEANLYNDLINLSEKLKKITINELIKAIEIILQNENF